MAATSETLKYKNNKLTNMKTAMSCNCIPNKKQNGNGVFARGCELDIVEEGAGQENNHEFLGKRRAGAGSRQLEMFEIKVFSQG